MTSIATILVLIITLGIVVGALVASVFLIPHKYGQVKDPGMFGDMLGGTNALFSGLALIGIVITLFLQRRQLEIQRREMQNTQFLTTTGILFEYYNAKISSLNVAIGQNRNVAENTKKRDELLNKHERLLSEFERRYTELLTSEEFR